MPTLTIDKEVATLTLLARFRDNKKNPVIGARVEDGTVANHQKIWISRKGTRIAEGEIVDLRQGRNAVKTMQAGSECGMEVHLTSIEEEPAVKDTIVAYVPTEEKKQFTM
jgi:translation initiation factor IF-2